MSVGAAEVPSQLDAALMTIRAVALRFGREYNADSPSAMAQDIAEHVAALAAQPTVTKETKMTTGAELIGAERQRQIAVEGWTPEHDAGHDGADLLMAARAYLERDPDIWPWAISYWKPSPDDRVRELIKAGALIAAEIDRLAAAVSGVAGNPDKDGDE